MKKEYIISIILVAIITIIIIIFPIPKSTLSVENTYTIEELQDYVVSTAISYYYNNKYTDYEGYWSDETYSDYSTMYNISPEMLSRSRYMTSQCDAFVHTCYMYSLGYDFSNYKNNLINNRYTSYVTNDGKRLYASSSDTVYKNSYKYFNKVFSVSYSNNIAKKLVDPKTGKITDPIVVLTYQQNGVSTINGVSDTSKSVSELLSGEDGKKIFDDIISSLQPGDIILNDGHAMLWVGDVFEKDGGAIHSSNKSLKLERDKDGNVAKDKNGNVKKYVNGYDAFDVRYTSANNIYYRGIKYHGSAVNTIITILRPINAICTFDKDGKCVLKSQYAKILSNTKARSKLKYLRTEQFLYDNAGGRVLGSDSASVNVGDSINYYLYLTNKSNFDFCTSGTTTNKDTCINSGFCSNIISTDKSKCSDNWNNNSWVHVNKNKDYNNIIITSKIPQNTAFVSCNENCTYNNGVVTWRNISISSKNTAEKKYRITVKVLDNTSSVEFEGMKITYDNSQLQMGSYKTFINSTVNGAYEKEFKKIINNDITKNKACSNGISYVLETYNNFLNIKNDTTKPVYTKINTDLSNILTSSNIVNGIFNKTTIDYFNKDIVAYTKKASNEVNKLTGNSKIINQMLVPYFYGGYRYSKLFHENMDYFYRVKPLWSSRINLNVGDIIITLKKTNNSFTINNAFMYNGIENSYPTYIICENNNIIKHGIRNIDSSHPLGILYPKLYPNNFLLYELYSSDLYVVLRPSMYYNLEYRNVNENKPEENPTKPEENPTKPEENPTKPEENPIKPEENPTKPEENPIKPEENLPDIEKNPNELEENLSTTNDIIEDNKKEENHKIIYLFGLIIGGILLLYILKKIIFNKRINNLLKE